MFSITSAGVVTILHSFGDGSVEPDGGYPLADLIQATDHGFYGTTYEGGTSSNGGTIFNTTLPGTTSILHSFGDGTVEHDGLNPTAGLTQGADGTFYGTTEFGGDGAPLLDSGLGVGTVFNVTASGAVTILHSFGDGSVANDGMNPEAGLVTWTGGSFYGMTVDGGSTGHGTIFRLNLSDNPAPAGLTATGGIGQVSLSWNASAGATSYNVFAGTAAGEESATAIATNVTQTAYTATGLTNGTTYYFEVTTSGVDESSPSNEASATPAAPALTSVIVSPGPTETYTLPATQQFTATAYDQYGNVMSPQPAITWSLSTGSAGSIGLTTGLYHGGPVPGTATVKAKSGLVSATSAVTLIPAPVTIAIPASATPSPAYGTQMNLAARGAYAGDGGAASLTYAWSATGPAAVSYSDNDDTTAMNTTVTFAATGTYQFTVTITSPVGTFATSSTTETALRTTTSTTPTFTIMHSFGDGTVTNDGEYPQSGVIEGADAGLYGATGEGGSSGDGVVYDVSPNGQAAILHQIDEPSDGVTPAGDLIQAADGSFYGAMGYLGDLVSDGGTAFHVTAAGQYTVLHAFADGTVPDDGVDPTSLIQVADGSFYGTTQLGGSAGSGVVFHMSPSGTITILHSFGDGTVIDDGAQPDSLILGSDGSFYGTTAVGGSTGNGAVFKMTADGQVTILHSFLDGSVSNDGQDPVGLIQSTDGCFYGMTDTGGSANGGGSEGDGAVFKMTPSGVVTILHSFGDGSVPNDGVYPLVGLTQGPDGAFYGTTIFGGDLAATDGGDGLGVPGGFGCGTVFRVTASGQVTIIRSFGDGTAANDGYFPGAGISLGKDGNLYGTTMTGGVANEGTVYRLAVLPAAPSGLIATAGDHQVSLSWSSAAGAATYSVYEGTASNGDGSALVAAGITGTSCVASGLTNGTTYYFEVTAVAGGEESGPSNKASGTPFAETLTSMTMTPGPTETYTLPVAQQFTATAYDQYGNMMMPQPAIQWSLNGGSVGSISYAGGLYHGGAVPGTATVKAASGALSVTSAITLLAAPVTVVTGAAAAHNPVNGSTVGLSALGAYVGSGGAAGLTYTWAVTSGPSGVTFSANGTSVAKNTTAHFGHKGAYTFMVTIASPLGTNTTSSVTLTVI